ncbi:hypothetical protein LEMLEM_LOCUS13699 [Lemmus lemmus]
MAMWNSRTTQTLRTTVAAGSSQLPLPCLLESRLTWVLLLKRVVHLIWAACQVTFQRTSQFSRALVPDPTSPCSKGKRGCIPKEKQRTRLEAFCKDFPAWGTVALCSRASIMLRWASGRPPV